MSIGRRPLAQTSLSHWSGTAGYSTASTPFSTPLLFCPWAWLRRPREQLIWTGEVLGLGLWLEEVSDSYRFLLSSIYGVLMIF